MLIVGCKNKEALFHPDAFYLIIISIDNLYARIVHFTQTVFGRLSVFQFFNVLFQPFYIQQIAFGTFLNGSIHHLLCRLHLIHLTPKAIGQQCTVRKADSVRSVQESGSFQQLHHFLPPAVRHIQRRRHTPLILYLEVILLYPVFQGMNHFENRVMDFNGSHLLFPPDVFLIGDLQLLVHHRFRFIRRGNHPVKFSHILNASHQTAKQETVPQGLQSLSLGRQFIGSGNQPFQRNTDGKLSVTVYFFIDNGEQCILNGRSSFPYLVQESNGGRRQIAIDNTLIRIFVFQFGNGDRAEYFVRRTES